MIWWLIGAAVYAAVAAAFYSVLVATAQPEPQESAMPRYGWDGLRKVA